MLTAEELSRRQPIWTAIATLWLDTETMPSDITEIAKVALESGYSIATLNDIYLYEIAPVVSLNSWIATGVWDGFDQTWLHDKARKRAETRSLWLRFWVWCGLGRRFMTYAAEEHWNAVMAQVQLSQHALIAANLSAGK
jgi:hypothetical protein